MNKIATAAAVALALTGLSSVARAATLSADFFDVPAGGPNTDTYSAPSPSNPTGDFGVCCSSPNATLPVIAPGSPLGPDGLPVTTLAASSGGVIAQNGAGEILWWSAAFANPTGHGAFTLGQLNNMFAPNSTGSNDNYLYETAILSGTLTGHGNPASITVASDDDALVYVGGVYVGGLPGVHPTEYTTINLGSFTGPKTLDIFFADRAQVGANLEVSVSGASVPEPAAWATMLLGLGALGGAMRQLRRRPSPAKA